MNPADKIGPAYPSLALSSRILHLPPPCIAALAMEVIHAVALTGDWPAVRVRLPVSVRLL